jgi:lysophospholipase L1-like esterase
MLLSVTSLLAADSLPSDAELQKVLRKIETGQAIKIACLGDSITQVTVHTGNRMSWPELFDQGLRQLYPKANLKMLNAGISGNTTMEGLNRLEKEVLSQKPALVIVMLGMNDAKLGEEKSLAAMDTIVAKIRAIHIPLVVCLQNYANNVAPPFTEARRQLLVKLQVPIVDCYSVFKQVFDEGKQTPAKGIEYQLLMSDNVHPNLEGQRLIVQTMVKALTRKDLPLSALPGSQPSIPLALTKAETAKLLNVTVLGLDDALVARALRKAFPRVTIKITPHSSQELTRETVKKKEPAVWQENGSDLLVVCFPEDANLHDLEYFEDINGLRPLMVPKHEIIWVGNSVLSSQPLKEVDAEREVRMIRFAAGMDVDLIRRSAKDLRAPDELIASWLKQQETMKRQSKHSR